MAVIWIRTCKYLQGLPIKEKRREKNKSSKVSSVCDLRDGCAGAHHAVPFSSLEGLECFHNKKGEKEKRRGRQSWISLISQGPSRFWSWGPHVSLLGMPGPKCHKPGGNTHSFSQFRRLEVQQSAGLVSSEASLHGSQMTLPLGMRPGALCISPPPRRTPVTLD